MRRVADTVVLSIGVTPDTKFLVNSGIGVGAEDIS